MQIQIQIQIQIEMQLNQTHSLRLVDLCQHQKREVEFLQQTRFSHLCEGQDCYYTVKILFVKDKIIMVKIEVHAGRHYGQKD